MSELTDTLSAAPQREVYSVARLNREVRALLDRSFPLLWVEGEISNFSRPSSGHWYFSLKDQDAQVRCAMFRMRNLRLGYTPENGMQVLARVRIGLYEPRGEFQLIVEHLEEAGDGRLQRAYEELKKRLAAEGVFDPARKQPLPALPRGIGVVTSPTGAAIRDILTTLKRRFPAIPVVIYPVPVQGAGAGDKIARAIRQAAAQQDCDVLIVARGGGSLEDLWAFNEEAVARAIYDCAIPVVSGVGHEVDVTIADFAADARAPTPTGAAELVSPDQNEWLQNLTAWEQRLTRLVVQQRRQGEQALAWLLKRLDQQHPGRRLRDQAQRLDELETRLKLAWRGQHRHATARLGNLTHQLYRHQPSQRLRQVALQQQHLAERLQLAMQHSLDNQRRQLAGITRALDAVSPLATLGRGYAIVQRLPERTVVRAATEVKVGDIVETRLARGRLLCTIDESHET